MSPTWRQKKAFLYFGGAAIILMGGAIILSAPYHYFAAVAAEGQTYNFEMWEGLGYYSELEFLVSASPDNDTVIHIDLLIRNNDTAAETSVNITLTSDDQHPDVVGIYYEERVIVPLETGNYTLSFERVTEVSFIDFSFTQLSDSRNFIIIGGAMNIVGLIMGGAGYFVAGSLIPTGEEAIIDWGYEEE